MTKNFGFGGGVSGVAMKLERLISRKKGSGGAWLREVLIWLLEKRGKRRKNKKYIK